MVQKGGWPMTEEDFRELFRKLLEHYRLPPETAAALLERILAALTEKGTVPPEGDGPSIV